MTAQLVRAKVGLGKGENQETSSTGGHRREKYRGEGVNGKWGLRMKAAQLCRTSREKGGRERLVKFTVKLLL